MGKKWSNNTDPNFREKRENVQEGLQQDQGLSEDEELKAFLEKGNTNTSSTGSKNKVESNRRYETALDHLAKEKHDNDLLSAEVSPAIKVSQEKISQRSFNLQQTTHRNSATPIQTIEDSFTDFDASPSVENSEPDPLEARSFVKEVFSGSMENKSAKEDLPDWVPMEDQNPEEIRRAETVESVVPRPTHEIERESIDSHRANKLEEYQQFNDNNNDKIDLIEEHQSQIQRATTINTANALTLKYIVFGAILLVLILAAGLGLISYKFRKQINELNQIIENSVLSSDDKLDIDDQQSLPEELAEELDELIESSPGTPLNANKKNWVSEWKDKSSSQTTTYNQQQAASILDEDPVNYTVERSEQDIVKKTLTKKNKLKNKSADDKLSEKIISKFDQNNYTKPSSSLIENNTAQKDAPVYKNTILDNNGWVVNLGAFQARQPAKRAADKYTKKGVPVEVVQITIGGQKWYRLRVEGFESKDEAVMYSTRVKKALKLDNVWVTVN